MENPYKSFTNNSTYKSINNFIARHTPKVKPVYEFVQSCVHDVTYLPEKPNAFDYVDLGFSFKKHFEDNFGGHVEPLLFFAEEKWVSPYNDAFWETAVRLITNAYPKKIYRIKTIVETHINSMTIDDVEFGWIENGKTVQCLYVRRQSQVEAASKILRKCFWEKHSSGRVMISEVDNKLKITDDSTIEEFIITKKSVEFAEYIKEFINQGYGRSLLFYGPPGSGKSNLVGGLCKTLDLKVLRFANLLAFNRNFIVQLIEIMEPDAIILDDIDNLSLDNIGDLLTRLESFNKRKKLIFATANQVTKLDDALIRPGRFDQAIEINHLDEEVLRALIDHDNDIYEVVKNFPVAFTVELMTRVKVLGKDRALANIDDLVARVENLESENYTLKKTLNQNDDYKAVPARRSKVSAPQYMQGTAEEAAPYAKGISLSERLKKRLR